MSIPAERLAKKARIKRATQAAQGRLGEIDAAAAEQLTAIYREAQADIEARIRAIGGPDGSMRLASLQQVRDQLAAAVSALAERRDGLLLEQLDEAARVGASVYAPELGISTQRIANRAAQYMREFVAEDGLQLSDRLWRLDSQATESMANAVQRAVISGTDASRAAQDYLNQGAPVPAEISARIRDADAGRVARQAASNLMTGEMSPHAQALRVFRTEINRAHGTAYRDAGFEDPEAIGTRFLLSPRHPRPDICDMHASADVYGLGPGVYPRGKSPWPAHPNTLSFEEIVYADEVTPRMPEPRVEWVRKQPREVRAGVLGGEAKRRAFDAGHIEEGAIATPWRVVRQRLQQRGIDTDEFERQGAA